jgi:hypothetical protein
METVKIDSGKLEKLKDELSKYAEAEGSEVGEAAQVVLDCLGYETYTSYNFFIAACIEAEEMLVDFTENYVWKDKSRTITENGKTTEQKWVELEHRSE